MRMPSPPTARPLRSFPTRWSGAALVPCCFTTARITRGPSRISTRSSPRTRVMPTPCSTEGCRTWRAATRQRGFEDIAKAIELDPTRYFFRYWRGLQYAKRDKVDAALADLDAAIRLNPDDRDSYLLRSELYTRKGEMERAIADLTRVTEIRPDWTAPTPTVRSSTSRPARWTAPLPTTIRSSDCRLMARTIRAAGRRC